MATDAARRISWDSVVIIDCLSKRPGRFEYIRPLVEQGEAGELMVVVSAAVAVAETYYLKDEPFGDDLRIIEEFYDRPWVHPETAGYAIGRIARDIRRKDTVDGADALHLATAVFTNCPVFLTNDGESKRSKKPLLPLDSKICLADGTPMRILTPEKYHAQRVAEANPLIAGAMADQDTGEAGDSE